MANDTLIQPEFICILDLTAATGGFFVKAMEETDIISAMDRVENAVRSRPGMVYIANILRRTSEKNEHGEVQYQAVLMARVSDEGSPISWVRRSAQNEEAEWDLSTWCPHAEPRNGYLLFADGGTIGV